MRPIRHALLTTVSVFLLCVSLSGLCSADPIPDDFDQHFEDATDVFLPPGTDPLLLKAQCYTESRLDPLAVSPVGAKGLCQFLDGTWGDATAALDVTAEDVWLPEASIRAAAWYMGKLHRTWSAPRPAMDRYMLAAASYNAGAGNIIEAQRLCDGQTRYRDVIPCLHCVTGHHSKETIGYVRAIVTRWYPALIFG